MNQNNLIKILNSYMLNNTNINIIKSKYNTNNIINNNKPASHNILKKKTDNIYIPKQLDTFFWCLYIIKYGMYEYNNIQSKKFIKEKNIKFEYVNLLRKNKILLKNKKIKKIDDIEHELISDKININALLVMCILDNINLFLINKNIYYELNNDDDDDKNYIVLHLINGKCGVEQNITKEQINDYKKTLLQVDNINKPLKSISSYKLDELQTMCIKLNIDINITNNLKNKPKNKQQLYEDLVMQV